MADTDLETLIGPALAGAITKKGYTTLTPVQEAVLDPALEGRDLRISSQTGSGKTVAIGLTLRAAVDGDVASTPKGAARPRALVVAPTRELAKQVETELSWLFAPLRVKVASVTGGGDFRDERRALGAGPAIVVGTPGRLLDHLKRGSVDGTQLAAVVLDEADRMLDLGFKEDLEAILAFAPEGHRTHLVSATFPREVTALANRVQQDPVRIEGTPLGTANTDIEHLVHLVLPNERLDAIVNLLLETPDGTTLIFARTRADVGELTHLLGEAGFTVGSLSGEMEQRERNKALAAFKRGDLDALVATDVAARGIDVQDIARVLHAEPPSDVDAYTHRSGRTGRAGRQGKSSVLVTPPALNRVSSLLNRAKVRWRFEPVPTAVSIESAREERLYERLTAVAPPVDPAEEPVDDPSAPQEADDRSWALAKRITEAGEATRALARMIARTRASGPEARRISVINAPQQRKPRPWEQSNDGLRDHAPRTQRTNDDRGFVPGDFARSAPRGNAEQAGREGRAFGEAGPGDSAGAGSGGYGEARGLRPDRGPMGDGGQARNPRDPATDAGDWTTFRVSWGQIHGADARRLLAMVCRRGNIRGSDVGAIRVARTFSTIAVSGAIAKAFEQATREPDPRDPKVRIRLEGAGSEGNEQEYRAPGHPKSVRELPAERSSAKDVGELPSDRGSVKSVPADRASAKSVKELPADRSSAKSVKDLPADRKSVKELPSDRASVKSVRELPSVKELPADRKSVKSVKELPADRKSVRELPSERASRSASKAGEERPSRHAVAKDERPSRARTLVVDKPSKTRDSDEKPSTPAPARDEEPKKDKAKVLAREEERPSPRSAHGDRASRPRPSQPERYARRPATPADGPSRDNDRGPRPGGPPSRDNDRGPRPPYSGGPSSRDNDRGPRPYSGGGPPSRGGPPGNDRGPRPPYAGGGDRRPPPGGGRPHGGPRPNGPPRQGEAPLKRKKP